MLSVPNTRQSRFAPPLRDLETDESSPNSPDWPRGRAGSYSFTTRLRLTMPVSYRTARTRNARSPHGGPRRQVSVRCEVQLCGPDRVTAIHALEVRGGPLVLTCTLGGSVIPPACSLAVRTRGQPDLCPSDRRQNFRQLRGVSFRRCPLPGGRDRVPANPSLHGTRIQHPGTVGRQANRCSLDPIRSSPKTGG